MKKIFITNCAAVFALGMCELSALNYNPEKAPEKSGWLFDGDKSKAQAPAEKTFREPVDASEYDKTGKEALDGWFVGAGMSQIASDSKASAIEHHYEWRGDVDFGMPIDRADLLPELLRNGLSCDNVTFTTGPAAPALNPNEHLTSFSSSSIDNLVLSNGKLSKLGGSVVAGYGSFVAGPVYVGGEVVVDFSGNKKKDKVNSSLPRGFNGVELESNGVKPSFAAILGAYISAVDALLYAKLGAAYSKTKVNDGCCSISLSKLSPLVGVGVKKNVYNNFSIGAEFDYLFESDRSGTLHNKVPALIVVNDRIEVDHSAKVKVKSKGYAIRATLMYNF